MGDVSNLALGWRTVMMGMVCLPILICALILLFRKTERPASRWLAFFLIAAILAVGPQIIGYAGFYNVWPGLTYLPLFSTELWLGPLIYLHADRLMRGGPLGWRKYLLIPGLVQLAYYSWAFFGLGDYKAKWAYNAKFHNPYIYPAENILTIALMLFAVIAIWNLTGRYRAHLQNTSSAALDYDPNWLRNFVFGLLVAGSIIISLEVIETMTSVSYNAAFPFQVAAMMVLAWIAIEAVWRLSQSFPKMHEPVTREQSSPENKQDWNLDTDELLGKIRSENWYLEPRLSVRDIAARMGTNETYISRALNQGAGHSFNGYINGLRVEHAKQLMKTTDLPILNIAFESGFNSKATFNRVFRDLTGQTPTQFKSSQNPQKS